LRRAVIGYLLRRADKLRTRAALLRVVIRQCEGEALDRAEFSSDLCPTCVLRDTDMERFSLWAIRLEDAAVVLDRLGELR